MFQKIISWFKKFFQKNTVEPASIVKPEKAIGLMPQKKTNVIKKEEVIEKKERIPSSQKPKVADMKKADLKVEDVDAVQTIEDVNKLTTETLEMDLFSENNYGKQFGNTELSWMSIAPEYRRFATKTIESFDKNPGIYFIKNKAGNVIYVGQSINIKKRIAEHILKSNEMQKIDRVIRKELDQFTFSSEYCAKTQLDAREAKYIAKYNPEFNFTSGGSVVSKNYKVHSYIENTGIISTKVNAKNKIISITGTFTDDDGNKISRTTIILIVEKLGAEYKKMARATNVWLVGKNPGSQKQSLIDDDDIQIDHPFRIQGFKDEYNKWIQK